MAQTWRLEANVNVDERAFIGPVLLENELVHPPEVGLITPEQKRLVKVATELS